VYLPFLARLPDSVAPPTTLIMRGSEHFAPIIASLGAVASIFGTEPAVLTAQNPFRLQPNNPTGERVPDNATGEPVLDNYTGRVSESAPALNIFPAELHPYHMKLNERSTLFPFSLPVPYAILFHNEQKKLGTHSIKPNVFECVMKHYKNVSECSFACQIYNCMDTVKGIIRDVLFYEANGRFPELLLHPEGQKRRLNFQLMFLRQDEIETFFVTTMKVSGFLKVEEYCLPNVRTSPHRLAWSHTYVIERFGTQCYLMQSDEGSYGMGHFMHPSHFTQATFPSRKWNGVLKRKALFGYHTASPRGVPCGDLYKRYLASYPELTAMKGFEKSCKRWLSWLNQTVRSGGQPQKINRIWQAVRNQPNSFRQGGVNDFMSCLFENVGLSSGDAPGRFIYLQDINPEVTLKEFGTRRHMPLSGGPFKKCAAIASVPRVTESELQTLRGA